MKWIIYNGILLNEYSIKAMQRNLESCVFDERVRSVHTMYSTFIELIDKQESSDREEPGTQGVLMNDCDTHIHYTIDEDYDIIIDKVVW